MKKPKGKNRRNYLRLIRNIRRLQKDQTEEYRKKWMDEMLYGTSVVKKLSNGLIQNIPIQYWDMAVEGKDETIKIEVAYNPTGEVYGRSPVYEILEDLKNKK